MIEAAFSGVLLTLKAWALSAHYDDAGYSGGTMERPALKRLLSDVAAGKVDIVVVYFCER